MTSPTRANPAPAAAAPTRAAATSPTIVITNHGHHHVTDNTAYNHYSLLRTFEAAFGLPCLAHACDSVVPTMAPLFANGHRSSHGRGDHNRRRGDKHHRRA